MCIQKTKGTTSDLAMCTQCNWTYEGAFNTADNECKDHVKFFRGHIVLRETAVSTTYQETTPTPAKPEGE